MKKTVVLTLLLCNILSVFAKDYSETIFKDCFNKTDDSYEFNIRNPFFIDRLYVKDVNKLKNKIIKETIESYYVDEQGRKSYSDSYDCTVSYLYYFFDSEGRITDKYYVDENDKGTVFYKQHESYKCLEDLYEIHLEDLKKNSEKKITAKVEKKDDCVLLLFDYPYEEFKEFEFRNNKVIRRRKSSKTITSIEEATINNTAIQVNKYIIRNGEIDYWGITNFEKCYPVKQKRFVPSGDEFYEYNFDNTGHGIYTYFKEGKTTKKIIKQEVYRRYNPIGFLEYEEIKPYQSNLGDYSFISVFVITKKDDFFISHFD